MSSVHEIPGEPFEPHAGDADLEVELELFYAFDPDLEVELELFYAFDPDLEVELELTHEELGDERELIRMPDHDRLDDVWFGTYDETAPVDFVDDEPTTPWRRFSTWVRNLKRAA